MLDPLHIVAGVVVVNVGKGFTTCVKDIGDPTQRPDVPVGVIL